MEKQESSANINDLKSFVDWGKEYVDKLKSNPRGQRIKNSMLSLLRSVGVSETWIHEVFVVNRGEALQNLIGESIAVIALLFAWKKEDKSAFSQALGEIGVAGVFVGNPLLLLISVVGLALGFNKMLNLNAIKKGGVLGFVGIGVSTMVPGGMIISFLAALIAVVIVNQHLKIEIPVEEQVKTFIQHTRSGGLKFQTQELWLKFENIVNELLGKVLPKFDKI